MELFESAKKASKEIAKLTSSKKNDILFKLAANLDKFRQDIISANQRDVENAKKLNLKKSLIDRLILNDKRIDAMIIGVEEIIKQDDPVGIVESGSIRPNGLKINKVRVPIGVIGIIYESRPNVTIDAAALCIKSGNSSILRGGKEANYSNLALGGIVKRSLLDLGLDENIVSVIIDPDRSIMNKMLKAKKIHRSYYTKRRGIAYILCG